MPTSECVSDRGLLLWAESARAPELGTVIAVIGRYPTWYPKITWLFLPALRIVQVQKELLSIT